MGQKVNPISFRICNGNNKIWSSNWFVKSNKEYANNVVSDIKIYNFFKENESKYSVCDVVVERKQNGKVNIKLESGKVSCVIGKNGDNIEKIEKQLKKIEGNNLSFDVKEGRNLNLNANFIARSIADRIENRQSFKRVVNTSIDQAIKNGAIGIKISCSGRLNGAEIARSETFKKGSIPLHTLRANIGYSCCNAITIYGVVGIKVWICVKR